MDEDELEPGVAVQQEEPVTSEDETTQLMSRLPPPIPIRQAQPLDISAPPVQSPVTTIHGPAPAVNPQQELFRRQAASNAALWKQLQTKTANMPLPQTEAAVAAALRFQGQRQYQRDLESGMAPAEALARSAPLMFSGPKQSNLGQAGAFIRATQKPLPHMQDVGGVLYRVNADGTVTSMTPPAPVKPPAANAFDTAEYRATLSEIAATRKALDAMEMASPEADQARGKIGLLTSKLNDIRKRSASPSPAKSSKRLKVSGPGGKRGTVPEGTKLPEGWSYVQ